jgi:hypothetical protein
VYTQGSVDKDYPYLLRVSLEHYHETAIKVLIYVLRSFVISTVWKDKEG